MPTDIEIIKQFVAAQCVAVPGGQVRYRLLYESFLSWLPAGSWWPIQRFGRAIDRAAYRAANRAMVSSRSATSRSGDSVARRVTGLVRVPC